MIKPLTLLCLGVVSLNQWYYFSPEGWRRLALGLDLREGGDDSDYLTGEGIRKESEQVGDVPSTLGGVGVNTSAHQFPLCAH
jgi:hypothetical protein